MSTDRGTDKGVVHAYSGILLSHKKEQNNTLCSNMDGPSYCHTEWGKPEKEISFDITYLWNLKQWYRWAYLRNRNSHRCRKTYGNQGASLVAQTVKNPPAMQETWVRSLDWKDPWKKEMATHSSVLAWRIPWTEPGGLQPMGSQGVRHNWTQHIPQGITASASKHEE